MQAELLDIRAKFADARRSVIDLNSDLDQDLEDLIQREDMVVTVSHSGYIKRVPLATYRAQSRGGKGRAGHDARRRRTRVNDLFVASTPIRPCCSSRRAGMVYKLKV